MKRFVVAYCWYDPDNYVGHRLIHLEAEDFDDCEKKFYSEMEKPIGRGSIEYYIMEDLPQSSYRVYNNKTKQRE